MKNIVLATFLIFQSLISIAQFSGGGRPGGGRMSSQMNIGHFYGKIVDSKTGKGLEGVTIQLKGNKFDTATKQMKEAILKTVLTESNGDFSLEGLMLFGSFKLKVSAIGFKTLEKQISFGIKMPQQGQTPDAAAMQQMMALADKDLGNLKIEVDATDLGAVTVTATAKQQFELGIDRKIFNVDKSITAAGQTASELMKSIPSVSVDIDGNVTLRNATPTIFIDGRPTTLTLDQIPVDIIDKVEIITNPSAKYDASGGNAGILNIVLKKNKKNGYNGNFRTGIDSRARVNLGGDINLRQNKINFSASGNYNQRKSISNNKTFTTLFTIPLNNINSAEDATNNGYFMFFRAGLDYFIDNRNTITINGSLQRGSFANEGLQTIDSSKSASQTYRTSLSDFNMRNKGLQLSYKHNFAKTGESISADVNYNYSKSDRISDNNSSFSNNSNTLLQRTDGRGLNKFLTSQIDFENQINETSKFEAGLRAAVRNFETESYQYFKRPVDVDYVQNIPSSVRYKFVDNVYAAYSTYSFKLTKTSFQLGLRAESSDYTGTLQTLSGADSSKFNINYAISLFPSVFITNKLSDKADLQLNYSRRVNRPNFFQLLPSYDFTDPQNPSVGNPNLKPEFTHSFELSYNNAHKKGANFLATVYFKYTNNLVTNFIYKDYNRLTNNTDDSLYYGSFINANNTYTYGLELTEKLPVTKWWDLMLNFNLYNSQINATIPNQVIDNNLVSWFSKVNATFKIAKGLSFQVNCESRSKLIIAQGGGGGNRMGGGMFGGGSQTLAQGYILPRLYDVDLALRKEWTWKNGRSGSVNLSVNDIFRSRRQTETNAFYFYQTTDRFRDPQVVRLNFNYRFGKLDMSLFKRKNTKAESGGMDMMQ
ncbi:MAG: TonB-dependent receptor domain-containing protein [Chitinophagaceae bacterium]